MAIPAGFFGVDLSDILEDGFFLKDIGSRLRCGGRLPA